jgi:hypothetical protein
VYSCSEKRIRVGFDMSDRTIPLLDGEMLIKLTLKKWSVDWIILPHNRVQQWIPGETIRFRFHNGIEMALQ